VVAAHLIQGGGQLVHRGNRQIAGRRMAAALVACQVEYFVHGHARQVACTQQLAQVRDNHQSGALERGGHFRDRDAGQPELACQLVHRPALRARDVRTADEIHQLQRQLL
jgi:hypothetical protein